MISTDSKEIEKKVEDRDVEIGEKCVNDYKNPHIKITTIDPKDFDTPLFPDKYITPDEVGQVEFTVNGLLKFLDIIRNYETRKFHDKKLLKLYDRKGTMLNDKFLLGKGEYAIPKNSIPSHYRAKDLFNAIYDPELRLKWDKGMKEFERIETINNNPNTFLFHVWCKSPIVLISERDFLEKRFQIVEDNFAYLFSFQAPNEFLPENKKVIRCINYFNIQLIEERKDYWLLTNLGQSDLKMPIPESFLNFTLAPKFNSWYESYVKFLNGK